MMTAARFYELLNGLAKPRDDEERRELERQLASQARSDAAKKAVATKKSRYPSWPTRRGDHRPDARGRFVIRTFGLDKLQTSETPTMGYVQDTYRRLSDLLVSHRDLLSAICYDETTGAEIWNFTYTRRV